MLRPHARDALQGVRFLEQRLAASAYDLPKLTAMTFILRERAMGNFVWPWALCVVVAVAWVARVKNVEERRRPRYNLVEFERMYSLIFTALGFMLVFRLSRAAVRFWDCRAAWGTIAMRGACRAFRPSRPPVGAKAPFPTLRAPLPAPIVLPPRRANASPPSDAVDPQRAVESMVDDAIVNLGRVAPEEVDEIMPLVRRGARGQRPSGGGGGGGVGVQRRAALRRGLGGERDRTTRHEVAKQSSSSASNRIRSAVARARPNGREDGGGSAAEARRGLHPHHAAEVAITRRRFEPDRTSSSTRAARHGTHARRRVGADGVRHPFTDRFCASTFCSAFVYVSAAAAWGWGTVPAVGAVAFALLGVGGRGDARRRARLRRNEPTISAWTAREPGPACGIMLRWWAEREEEVKKDEGTPAGAHAPAVRGARRGPVCSRK